MSCKRWKNLSGFFKMAVLLFALLAAFPAWPAEKLKEKSQMGKIEGVKRALRLLVSSKPGFMPEAFQTVVSGTGLVESDPTQWKTEVFESQGISSEDVNRAIVVLSIESDKFRELIVKGQNFRELYQASVKAAAWKHLKPVHSAFALPARIRASFEQLLQTGKVKEDALLPEVVRDSLSKEHAVKAVKNLDSSFRFPEEEVLGTDPDFSDPYNRMYRKLEEETIPKKIPAVSRQALEEWQKKTLKLIREETKKLSDFQEKETKALKPYLSSKQLRLHSVKENELASLHRCEGLSKTLGELEELVQNAHPSNPAEWLEQALEAALKKHQQKRSEIEDLYRDKSHFVFFGGLFEDLEWGKNAEALNDKAIKVSKKGFSAWRTWGRSLWNLNPRTLQDTLERPYMRRSYLRWLPFLAAAAFLEPLAISLHKDGFFDPYYKAAYQAGEEFIYRSYETAGALSEYAKSFASEGADFEPDQINYNEDDSQSHIGQKGEGEGKLRFQTNAMLIKELEFPTLQSQKWKPAEQINSNKNDEHVLKISIPLEIQFDGKDYFSYLPRVRGMRIKKTEGKFKKSETPSFAGKGIPLIFGELQESEEYPEFYRNRYVVPVNQKYQIVSPNEIVYTFDDRKEINSEIINHLLDPEALKPWVKHLEDAGFSPFAKELEKEIQEAQSENRKVWAKRVREMAQKKTLYSYYPYPVRRIGDRNNPLYDLSERRNEDGFLCAQCTGSKELIRRILQDAARGDSADYILAMNVLKNDGGGLFKSPGHTRVDWLGGGEDQGEILDATGSTANPDPRAPKPLDKEARAKLALGRIWSGGKLGSRASYESAPKNTQLGHYNELIQEADQEALEQSESVIRKKPEQIKLEEPKPSTQQTLKQPKNNFITNPIEKNIQRKKEWPRRQDLSESVNLTYRNRPKFAIKENPPQDPIREEPVAAEPPDKPHATRVILPNYEVSPDLKQLAQLKKASADLGKTDSYKTLLKRQELEVAPLKLVRLATRLAKFYETNSGASFQALKEELAKSLGKAVDDLHLDPVHFEASLRSHIQEAIECIEEEFAKEQRYIEGHRGSRFKALDQEDLKHPMAKLEEVLTSHSWMPRYQEKGQAIELLIESQSCGKDLASLSHRVRVTAIAKPQPIENE